MPLLPRWQRVIHVEARPSWIGRESCRRYFSRRQRGGPRERSVGGLALHTQRGAVLRAPGPGRRCGFRAGGAFSGGGCSGSSKTALRADGGGREPACRVARLRPMEPAPSLRRLAYGRLGDGYLGAKEWTLVHPARKV